MVDVSLEYRDAYAYADGRTPLASEAGRVVVWVDSEEAVPLPAAAVRLDFTCARRHSKLP